MQQQRLMTVRILWGALFASTAMFLVVLFVVPKEGTPMPILPPAFGVMALGMLVLSFAIPRAQQRAAFERAKLEVSEEADPQASGIIPYRDAPKRRVFADAKRAETVAFVAYQPALILGCAMSEAVALFGFVLGYMGHPPQLFLPFFVVAWISFAVRFPTLARVRGPLEQVKGAVFPG